MTLYSQASQSDKNNLSFKNNLAVTALLLDASEKRPHDLALEVYTKAPTNASFASTYAYSLLLQKKRTDALRK